MYKNEGNDESKKEEFSNAIHFYTEGINVNCKDKELIAKLYTNRASAHFNLGEMWDFQLILPHSDHIFVFHNSAFDFIKKPCYVIHI